MCLEEIISLKDVMVSLDISMRPNMEDKFHNIAKVYKQVVEIHTTVHIKLFRYNYSSSQRNRI